MDTDKKTFLYRQVYQDLKDKIVSGYHKPGELLPSEREVGEAYHVDRTTVRKAFSLLVEEGLVEKKAGKGSVVIRQGDEKEDPAGAPSPNGAKTIAFLLPKSTNKSDRITVPFYSELFYNIEKECRALGYTLLYSSLDDSEDLGHLLDQHKDISGIMFVSNISAGCITQTVEKKIPCVLLNSVNPQIPSVLSDNYSGTYAAAGYLIQKGHRDIAILNGIPDYVSARERYQGAAAAMASYGVTIKKEHYMCADTWEADGGYRVTEAMLAACSKPPTAILAFNDRLASGAIQAIRQAGLSVPDDISIIGYDNSDHARYSIPRISTVEIHVPWMAKAALRNLMDQIAYGERYPLKILIPATLTLYDSVKDLQAPQALV